MAKPKAKPRSWWRMRQIRHRDAVALAVLSASLLLAGELANQDIQSVYHKYIVPSGALNNLGFLILIVALVILGFTTYFGGVFVLLGGLHFSWGRVGRGRFLVGLGIGVSLIGLLSRLAQAVLVTGTPLAAIVPYTTSLNGLPIRSAAAAATRVSFPRWYTFIRMGIGGSRLQPFDELILVFRGAVNLAFLRPALQPSVHFRGRDATLLRDPHDVFVVRDALGTRELIDDVADRDDLLTLRLTDAGLDDVDVEATFLAGHLAHPVLDDSHGALRVLRADGLAQPEPSTGLGKPDDRLELPRGHPA